MHKKFIYSVLVLFFLGISCFAEDLCFGQEPSVTASVDRDKIYADETVVFQVKVVNITEGGELLIPDFLDFEVISSRVSYQLVEINDKRSKAKIYTYVLEAAAPGEYLIDSVILKTKSHKYTTPPVKIEVLPPKALPPKALPYGGSGTAARPSLAKGIPVDIGNGDIAYAELTSNFEEVYVGQQLDLIFRLYYRQIHLQDLDYTEPSSKGFLEEALGPETQYYKSVNGLRYAVKEYKKALFPLSAGEHTISPALMTLYHMDSSFFGFMQKKEELATRPLLIKVKPLPMENKPEFFTGAVGEYDVRASISTKVVKVGEPVTLRMRIYGKGNVKTIAFPEMKDIPGFKTYEPEVKNKIDALNNKVIGEKIWEKIFVPKWAGTHEITAPDFSFFNPYKKKYEVLKGPTFSLKVDKLSAEERTQGSLVVGGNDSVNTASEDAVNVIRQNSDINFIKTGQVRFVRKNRTLIFYLLFFLLPFFIFIGFVFYYRKSSRIRTDARYARKINAGRNLNKMLKEAKKAVKKEDASTFYLSADKAIRECISNKTASPSAGMTVDTIVDILREKNMDTLVISDVCELLDKCDMVKFVSAKVSKNEISADYDKLRETLSSLLKKL